MCSARPAHAAIHACSRDALWATASPASCARLSAAGGPSRPQPRSSPHPCRHRCRRCHREPAPEPASTLDRAMVSSMPHVFPRSHYWECCTWPARSLMLPSAITPLRSFSRAGMSHEMLTPICALRGRQRRACCKLLGDAAIPGRCYAACIEDVMWRISSLLLAGVPCGAR